MGRGRSRAVAANATNATNARGTRIREMPPGAQQQPANRDLLCNPEMRAYIDEQQAKYNHKALTVEQLRPYVDQLFADPIFQKRKELGLHVNRMERGQDPNFVKLTETHKFLSLMHTKPFLDFLEDDQIVEQWAQLWEFGGAQGKFGRAKQQEGGDAMRAAMRLADQIPDRDRS